MSYNYGTTVKDFASLYAVVTNNIKEYVAESRNGLTQYRKDWILELVDGFQKRYEDWEVLEKDYLSKLASKRGRLFWLGGCAFLHIAKDLPIVIERTLHKQMTGEEIFNHKVVFNALEKPLEKSLKADWSKPFGAKFLFWEGWHTEQIFFHWMFNLRHKAWDHALLLLYSPNLPLAIDDLHSKIIGAMANAQEKHFFWDRILSLKVAMATSYTLLAISAISLFFTPTPIIFNTIIFIIVLFEGYFLVRQIEYEIFDSFLTELYIEFAKITESNDRDMRLNA